MKKITAIAIAFMAVLSYGSFAYASIIYTQPVQTGTAGTGGMFLTDFPGVGSSLDGKTVTYLTVNAQPQLQPTFQYGFGNGSCGGSVTYFTFNWSDYGIDYHSSNFYLITVPINYTFPTTGAGGISSCTFNRPDTVTKGISSGQISAISFCDTSDCPLAGQYPPGNLSQTRFISIAPISSTTIPTTYSVGASVHANPIDFDPATGGRLFITFTQDSAFACMNSGAVYDAIATCTGSSSPSLPFSISFESSSTLLLSGNYDLYATTTFPSIGAWTGVYQIQQISSPWYFFGLSHSYNTLVTATSHFIVSTSSAMDMARASIALVQANIASTTAHDIASVLASTTAQWGTSCQPFSSAFNMGDCLTLTFWPGDQGFSDDVQIIKETPPWGYVFRVIDILNATTSSTTLPSIDYTFATSSPLSADVGDIHFDPFLLIQQSGTLINQMKSDQAGNPTVWTILMPVVQIFVYLVLLTMIIHDLTGVYNHGPHKSRGVNNDNEK